MWAGKFLIYFELRNTFFVIARLDEAIQTYILGLKVWIASSEYFFAMTEKLSFMR